MVLLLSIFIALILFIIIFLGNEGRKVFVLNAQVEMNIILEDIENVTNCRVYIRLYKSRLNRLLSTANNTQLETI